MHTIQLMNWTENFSNGKFFRFLCLINLSKNERMSVDDS